MPVVALVPEAAATLIKVAAHLLGALSRFRKGLRFLAATMARGTAGGNGNAPIEKVRVLNMSELMDFVEEDVSARSNKNAGRTIIVDDSRMLGVVPTAEEVVDVVPIGSWASPRTSCCGSSASMA